MPCTRKIAIHTIFTRQTLEPEVVQFRRPEVGHAKPLRAPLQVLVNAAATEPHLINHVIR